MNEILEKMKTRRSVRSFKPDAIPNEVLDKIIEAGIFAASGRNKQAPGIVAVPDKDTRDRISKVNAEIMGSSNDPFYGAPVILIVIAPKDVTTYVYDGSRVMGNLMLAAHSLGVSSCWIHRARETFERPEWKQWLRDIGVEGDMEGIGHCALGYACGDYPDVLPRKEGRVFKI